MKINPSVNISISQPVVTPSMSLTPCQLGMHLWAWLTAGGMECYRCGLRR